MQVKQLLEQQYPGMEVVGSMYPVPPFKAALAQAAGAAQMAGFAVVLFGERLFPALGYVPLPQWYVDNIQGNRMGAGVGVWFVGNFIQGQLVSTGAFEVFYDGELVFSKLATSRMPSAEELIGPIEAQRAAKVKDSDETAAAELAARAAAGGLGTAADAEAFEEPADAADEL